MSKEQKRVKTTVKVARYLWDKLNKECKAASLRRDDLINRVLPGEVALLDKIQPCDADGEKYLKNTWCQSITRVSDSDHVSVPLTVTEDVLLIMNETCKKKGVHRDAFFNCVLRFIVYRIYESVLVIKNPRTLSDISSKLIAVSMEEDDKIREFYIKIVINEWHDLSSSNNDWISTSYYSDYLSYNKERIERDNEMYPSLFAIDI